MVFDNELDQQRWAVRRWLTDVWSDREFRSWYLQYLLQKMISTWAKILLKK